MVASFILLYNEERFKNRKEKLKKGQSCVSFSLFPVSRRRARKGRWSSRRRSRSREGTAHPAFDLDCRCRCGALLLRPSTSAASTAAPSSVLLPRRPPFPPLLLPCRHLLPLRQDHVVPRSEHPHTPVLGQPHRESDAIHKRQLQPEERRAQEVGTDAQLSVVPFPRSPVESW